ncbi:MAG: hypothetical protein OYL97_12110 [Candidatus Poribacteria bacterium]|nr:hypothetical protein [Candidatus Poribacteria bacterium]
MEHDDNNNAEKQDEEQQDEKRSSLFTVKDIESALIYFTCMTGLYPFVVIAHEIYHGWKGGWETTYLILKNVPTFFGIATTLIVFKEGVDIMFRRWQEAREISRQERAAIAEAAKAEGKAEGIAEGVAEGRAEAQRQWREWYQRQTEAQEKGQPFTEPPPNLKGDTPGEE